MFVDDITQKSTAVKVSHRGRWLPAVLLSQSPPLQRHHVRRGPPLLWQIWPPRGWATFPCRT